MEPREPRPPRRVLLGTTPSDSVTPVQAALLVGATAGLAAAAVFSAPVWGAILVGAGAAAATNAAIQRSA